MNEIQIIPPTAIESQERAQVDMQIATAKRYPRSLSAVKETMLSFATLDVETAQGCFYTLKGRKGGDGKPIQGPSIRLAEIALASYQNIKAQVRVISDDGKFITAQAMVFDMQNNIAISREVQRRVTNKDGIRYSDDMIATTANAACSIALRNAIFSVVPLALVNPVYHEAKKLAVGDAKSLVERRASCLEKFAKMNIDKETVCRIVEVRKPDDIQLEQLELLIGYFTALRDGQTTIDELLGKVEADKKDPLKEAFEAEAGTEVEG